MLRTLLTSLSAVCCSLGMLTLTQCGGSGADGLAPSDIADMQINCMITGFTGGGTLDTTNIRLPQIFIITTDESRFSIESQGESLQMWNGTGTYSYQKTGKDTASLTLTYIENSGTDSQPDTKMNTIRIPQLTFDNTTHASSGAGGATIAYTQASDRDVVSESNVTISLNFFSQL